MSESNTLLVELGSEELPPKALAKLAQAFANEMANGLENINLGFGNCSWYATPRRLAVKIDALQSGQQDKEVNKRGPALKAAYDQDGKPTKAAQGFAQSCGVSVDKLETIKTDKGEWLSYKTIEVGKQATEVIPEIIETALKRLPIPKRMRWGNNSAEFVRPVHWIVVMLGEHVVPCRILELDAGNTTRGHRFHSPDEIVIRTPETYLEQLEKEGQVIADYEERKQQIVAMTTEAAKERGGEAYIDSALLDEVTSLVESPHVIIGEFDPGFLSLPEEVLISTMQNHQKYFPVRDKENKLMACFITISNIHSSDPEAIKKGNERVIFPRLSDAAFFWQRDCASSFEDNVDGLKSVIFQKDLGTIFEKSERIGELARFIGTALEQDEKLITESTRLAKCDLISNMVSEFPDLQGTMGAYYAHESGVDDQVALAIKEQYMPRHAGDVLPQSKLGQILSIADKLDTIMGIFAIGQIPTGEKDPFALRRAALGCLRIMIECELDLDLVACLKTAAKSFDPKLKADDSVSLVFNFMMERLRRYYLDNGVSPFVFDAVFERQPVKPLDFHRRVEAVAAFTQLPEAVSLAAANKRINNILKQAEDSTDNELDDSLFQEQAEIELNRILEKVNQEIQPLKENSDYTSIMATLAGLRDAVDSFFDEVMVMCDDDKIRQNRINLLRNLRELFLLTADISRLQ